MYEDQDYLKDLMLIVPEIPNFQISDWLILFFWFYTFLIPYRSQRQTLLLFSFGELIWAIYSVSIGEFAQSVVFFTYFFSASWKVFRLFTQEK